MNKSSTEAESKDEIALPLVIVLSLCALFTAVNIFVYINTDEIEIPEKLSQPHLGDRMHYLPESYEDIPRPTDNQKYRTKLIDT